MNQRTMVALVFALAAAFTLSVSAQEKKNPPVKKTTPAKKATPLLPDKKLEAFVRSNIFAKKNNAQPLTEADLLNVFVLKEGDGKGIKSLAGLEKCTNLMLIRLAKNEISDLAPLASTPSVIQYPKPSSRR